MKNNNERIDFIQAALKTHENFWESQTVIITKLRNAYLTDFYKDQEHLLGRYELPVESAIGFGYIESILGSLFTTAPGVEVDADPIRITGDPDVAQLLINRFLQRKRSVIEQVVRLALIYPCAFMKLAPRESTDPLERVDIKAIEPWNVIVDVDADAWENQRFVGHIYWLPVPEAKKRFGPKDFVGCDKDDYFDRTSYSASSYSNPSNELPDDFKYVKIVELYDFVNEELYFWSPDWNGGQAILDRTPIPIRDWDGTSLAAIVPLYFSNDPSKPLRGYSALARIYDQIKEHNLLRSRMASAIRKDARQFLYQKDVVDQNALEAISRGEDGEMIAVDGPIIGAIAPISNPPVNSDYINYEAMIDKDLIKGSIQAPFSRGESSRTTATEINQLAIYTHSEIGMRARQRDMAIESLANLYLRILILAFEEGEKIAVATTEGPKLVSAETIDGKFLIQALEAGNSPVADFVKKQALTGLIQHLTALGANREVLLQEIIKVYKLPGDLLKPAAPPEMSGVQQAPVAAIEPLSASALRSLIHVPSTQPE